MNQAIYDGIKTVCLNDSALLLCHPLTEGDPPVNGFNLAYNIQFKDQTLGVVKLRADNEVDKWSDLFKLGRCFKNHI